MKEKFFLPIGLEQILLLVAPLLIFIVLFKKRFQPGESVREERAKPPQVTAERSQKKLMEALGLPESMVPPGPLSKKAFPPSEKLSPVSPRLLSQKSEGRIDFSTFAEKKVTSQVRQRSLSFQIFDRALLQHAIVAREVLGPPRALVGTVAGAPSQMGMR
ncbi:hypothetical protein AMD24_00686 [Candidatus Xiphinematobacter sp. Idaho Grape]|uniref:hypothetical protein n=1 Tax=Candidatus Xiphinematobacter sp. Idaho Grape TaxID=1704307 RepID=UPI00070608AB|nr:hypothetical protein [Candidatus Xiphinematobacter sp. Idaho Grape]ALJ56851.1 hypothetical protein AMD24_00686 [Candidatus Xiphinematobacter sp. Idaho Grape]